jgi:LPS export ABC transporter protein LptC
MSRPTAPAPGSATVDQPPIGYYSRNTVVARTDDSGRIYYRVFAGLLERASESDDLVLSEVRVEYDESEDVRWTVSAGRGVAPHGREYLDLFDGVRLATTPDGGGEPVVIEAERLRLDSAGYMASSDETVSIMRGDAMLSATGFSVDLKEDVIELHHNVKAQSSP